MNLDIQNIKQRFEIIGTDPNLDRAIEKAMRVSPTDISVLITGESGVGKEIFPKIIHQLSHRKHNKFIAVNCGAIPHELLESELFGYEKGSFTGAINTRIGRLELANQGTIFLDEIGDMPTSLQVKLLRVLAEREIDRLGSTKPTPIDIRVITATHRNLEESMRAGKFREDLFYRLNIIPINLPPLRERKTDIPLLANHFLKQLNGTAESKTISEEAMHFLVNYSWPGNIRELANFVERMLVLSIGSTITPRDLPEKILGDAPKEKWQPLNKEEEGNPAQMLQQSLKQSFHVGIPEDGINLKKTVEEFEKELLLEALEKTGWVKNKAANLLGLNRTTLVEKLKKLQISSPAK